MVPAKFICPNRYACMNERCKWNSVNTKYTLMDFNTTPFISRMPPLPQTHPPFLIINITQSILYFYHRSQISAFFDQFNMDNNVTNNVKQMNTRSFYSMSRSSGQFASSNQVKWSYLVGTKLLLMDPHLNLCHNHKGFFYFLVWIDIFQIFY